MSEANDFSKRLFANFVAVRLRAWRVKRDEQHQSGLERVHDAPLGADSDTFRVRAQGDMRLKEDSPDSTLHAFDEPGRSG
jgi:hypothetical protein